MARYKLLLADDSLTIQKVVELVLADENFDIRAVDDGEQALATFESFKPDIVLADIDMPKLNGYQLCEKIKSDTATVHIPVILLSSAFEPYDEEYAKSIGADDNIIKPFESQELISKVKSLLVKAEPVSKGVSLGADVKKILPPVLDEEAKYDEEIQVETKEKDMFKDVVDEELLVESAPTATNRGFEDQLSDAMKVEIPLLSGVSGLAYNLELPSKYDIEEIVRQSIDRKVSDIFGIDGVTALAAVLREAVSLNLSQNAPGIVENVTRQLVTDIAQSLHGEISAMIARVVPEVAETIIKKEIEKITVRT